VIALVDYKAGNLTSVRKALAAVGADVVVPQAPSDLRRAAGVIVPGVGHFSATRALDSSWVDAVRTLVAEGRPLLGICLGLQWLFEGSDEDPQLPGLGLLAGRCYRLQGQAGLARQAGQERLRPHRAEDKGIRGEVSASVRGGGGAPPQVNIVDAQIKVPHVGWNSLELVRDSAIAAGVANGAQVYFTHSYVAPITADTVASTDHGEPFASIVERGHVSGAQFHPEKSGDVGLRILRNFLKAVQERAA
jgi:glutamine amidotransferase